METQTDRQASPQEDSCVRPRPSLATRLYHWVFGGDLNVRAFIRGSNRKPKCQNPKLQGWNPNPTKLLHYEYRDPRRIAFWYSFASFSEALTRVSGVPGSGFGREPLSPAVRVCGMASGARKTRELNSQPSACRNNLLRLEVHG